MLRLQFFHQGEVLFQMFVKFLKDLNKINLLFMILSVIYILGIFFLSDSSIVSSISYFNPYSLLHIPLYGILTLLLYLSFKPNFLKPSQNLSLHFLLPIIISLMVAILDEIHQIYIPFREASMGDIFLDTVGIALMTFILITARKKKFDQIS